MSNASDFDELVEATLTLLKPYERIDSFDVGSNEPLLSLLSQCEIRCEALANTPAEPVRTLHHFACSGGTVMSRAIAAQSNITLLSEVDPLSTLTEKITGFAPSDVIGLARSGVGRMPDEVIIETFLASLEALFDNLSLIGRCLVLRDHAHSQFCTDIQPDSRPSLRKILSDRFALRSVVTVRHPLDSYLSLISNGWTHFTPFTLEEYSKRYLMFLDEYSDLPVFLYEKFTIEPDKIIQEISQALNISYTANWQDLLPIIALSGDSGRKGNVINGRPRKLVSSDVETETINNPTYEAVCDRLGYNSGPSMSPLRSK